MANMSYCRFQNTLQDLRDCQEAMCETNADEWLESLSSEERKAAIRLIKLCSEITHDFEYLTEDR